MGCKALPLQPCRAELRLLGPAAPNSDPRVRNRGDQLLPKQLVGWGPVRPGLQTGPVWPGPASTQNPLAADRLEDATSIRILSPTLYRKVKTPRLWRFCLLLFGFGASPVSAAADIGLSLSPPLNGTVTPKAYVVFYRPTFFGSIILP